jgi:hypothetical protein
VGCAVDAYGWQLQFYEAPFCSIILQLNQHYVIALQQKLCCPSHLFKRRNEVCNIVSHQ